MKHPLIYSLAFLLLMACGPSDNREYAPALQENVPTAKENTSEMPRKLIRNGSISFTTDDINESYKFITGVVGKYKGYISSEQTYNYDKSSGYTITARVPAENFDKLLAEIANSTNIKELEEKSISISDVTEEFIDVEARLKVKKESEQRLLDLLKQAKNVSEIAAINEQLTNMRADIESIEGRLKYLDNQVNYSTLEIRFSKKTRISGRFYSEISNGFGEGWQIFLGLISLLSYLWVIILVIILIWRLVVFYRRRKRKS